MLSTTRVSPASSDDVLAGFLTPDQLAAQLGVSRRTLARLHARREGPARCTVGRLILYRAETVHVWLVAREHEPPGRDRRRR